MLIGRPLEDWFGHKIWTGQWHRNVAPNKDMYRVSFKLSLNLLTTTKEIEIKRKRCAEEEEVAATKVKCV